MPDFHQPNAPSHENLAPVLTPVADVEKRTFLFQLCEVDAQLSSQLRAKTGRQSQDSRIAHEPDHVPDAGDDGLAAPGVGQVRGHTAAKNQC